MPSNWQPNATDSLLLLEAVSEAVFVTDRRGSVLALNPLAQQLVGMRNEVVGRALHQVLGCVDPYAAPIWPACPIEHAMVSGTVVQLLNHDFLCEEGRRMTITLTCWPRYHGHDCEGSLVVCRDLTNQRRSERELRRLALLAEQAPTPIIELDSSARLQYANTAMLNVLTELGLSRDDFASILPENLNRVLHTCLKDQQPIQTMEVAVANRVFAWSFFPLHDAGLSRAYGREITAEVRLRRAKHPAEKPA